MAATCRSAKLGQNVLRDVVTLGLVPEVSGDECLKMRVLVQNSAGYPQKHPNFAGTGPGNGPLPAADGPKSGTSTAKVGVFEADGPNFGTSAALHVEKGCSE